MDVITAVETITVDELPNHALVVVHTEAGRTGLGEAFYGVGAALWVLEHQLAPALIGREVPTSAAAIEACFDPAAVYVGQQGSGAEIRARAALDLALWDLWARVEGVPLFALLGADAPPPPVELYNTCAGPFYTRDTTGQQAANWGLGRSERFDDLWAFLHEPERLAESLLAEGVRAMKIWPFDPAAEATGGRSIDAAALEAGAAPFERIRAAVGEEMGLLLELHALWEPGPARRIIDRLAGVGLVWAEDPIGVHRAAELAELRAAVATPVAAGETAGFGVVSERLLEAGAVDVLITDLAWCGGLGPALGLRDRAAVAGTGWAVHDCSGPVAFTVGATLAATSAGVARHEMTRAYLGTWYPELVTGLPQIEAGHARLGEGPGHGLAVRAGLRERPGVRVRRVDADHRPTT